MTTIELRTGLKRALTHVEQGDPEESVSCIDLIQSNLPQYEDVLPEDFQKYLARAREEIDIGSPEKGEIWLGECITMLAE